MKVEEDGDKDDCSGYKGQRKVVVVVVDGDEERVGCFELGEVVGGGNGRIWGW